MSIRHAPTSEDFDNFTFEASQRLGDLLRGELDLSSMDYLGDEDE